MQTAPEGADGSRRRRLVVLALAAIVYVALMIAGLGLVSLATDEDIVAVGGMGSWPGALGMTAAVAAWAGVLGGALVRRPGVGTAAVAGLAGALAYTLAVFVVAFFGTAEALTATAAAWRLVTHGFSITVALAGLLAATGAAVALRAGPGVPRWPWERDTEE